MRDLEPMIFKSNLNVIVLFVHTLCKINVLCLCAKEKVAPTRLPPLVTVSPNGQLPRRAVSLLHSYWDLLCPTDLTSKENPKLSL